MKMSMQALHLHGQNPQQLRSFNAPFQLGYAGDDASDEPDAAALLEEAARLRAEADDLAAELSSSGEES